MQDRNVKQVLLGVVKREGRVNGERLKRVNMVHVLYVFV
jgi:hypothetical protein